MEHPHRIIQSSVSDARELQHSILGTRMPGSRMANLELLLIETEDGEKIEIDGIYDVFMTLAFYGNAVGIQNLKRDLKIREIDSEIHNHDGRDLAAERGYSFISQNSVAGMSTSSEPMPLLERMVNDFTSIAEVTGLGPPQEVSDDVFNLMSGWDSFSDITRGAILYTNQTKGEPSKEGILKLYIAVCSTDVDTSTRRLTRLINLYKVSPELDNEPVETGKFIGYWSRVRRGLPPEGRSYVDISSQATQEPHALAKNNRQEFVHQLEIQSNLVSDSYSPEESRRLITMLYIAANNDIELPASILVKIPHQFALHILDASGAGATKTENTLRAIMDKCGYVPNQEDFSSALDAAFALLNIRQVRQYQYDAYRTAGRSHRQLAQSLKGIADIVGASLSLDSRTVYDKFNQSQS